MHWRAHLAEPAAQRRWAVLASAVLAAACAWLAVRLLWTLLTPAPPAASALPAALPAAGATPAARVDVARYHLFGVYRASPALDAFRDAPETPLDLELRGIVSAADADAGFAIIVHQGRQAVYGREDELPGGASIEAIYPDRVVLARAGRFETLRLPIDRGAGQDDRPAPSAPESPARPPMVATRPPDGMLDGLSFNSLAGRYGLVPVSGGGYRLFLSRDAAEIARLGLQNGDVLKSANGVALNETADVEKVIAEVLSGERLTLLVERRGQQITVRPDVSALMGEVR